MSRQRRSSWSAPSQKKKKHSAAPTLLGQRGSKEPALPPPPLVVTWACPNTATLFSTLLGFFFETMVFAVPIQWVNIGVKVLVLVYFCVLLCFWVYAGFLDTLL